MESPSCVLCGIIALLFLIIIFKTQICHRFVKWTISLRTYKRLFAFLYNSWREYPVPSRRIREKLLAQVIERLAKVGGDILEIGTASGKNLEFMRLPARSSLIAVDCNPDMEAYFRENVNKFANNNIHLKRFVVEDAANMKSIEDDSVSLVLATQFHCSLEEGSIRKALSEIKRVLKEGGYYFFMEHVLDEPGTLRRFLQKLAYSVDLLPLLCDGCRCDKETWKYLYEAEFKEVSYRKCLEESFFYWSAPLLSLLRYMSRSKIVGFAIK